MISLFSTVVVVASDVVVDSDAAGAEVVVDSDAPPHPASARRASTSANSAITANRRDTPPLMALTFGFRLPGLPMIPINSSFDRRDIDPRVSPPRLASNRPSTEGSAQKNTRAQARVPSHHRGGLLSAMG